MNLHFTLIVFYSRMPGNWTVPPLPDSADVWQYRNIFCRTTRLQSYFFPQVVRLNLSSAIHYEDQFYFLVPDLVADIKSNNIIKLKLQAVMNGPALHTHQAAWQLEGALTCYLTWCICIPNFVHVCASRKSDLFDARLTSCIQWVALWLWHSIDA